MTAQRLQQEEMVRAGIGQRRFVAILFSDISDSSGYAERLEAEEYSGLLERFRFFAHEIIPRHGGTIARMQGDGLLAVFGSLGAREDDGRRAAEAALELHAAVRQLPTSSDLGTAMLQLHSGIHGGLVLLIEGDIERGRFDVVGEVPNTASRLCSLAASGEILVSVETLGPQAHFFQVSATSRLPIRGRSTTLNVCRVEGRAAVERRIDAAARRGVVPFVGREEAMKQLFDLAYQVRLGESGAIVVSGEPGIGKTRLIDEFQRQLVGKDFRILRGYCENYLGAEPLQPFLQAIRGALGVRAGLSLAENEAAINSSLTLLGGEISTEFRSLVHALMGGQADSTATPSPGLRTSTIVDCLTLLASQTTLVLVLDDWQWADNASRQALDLLLAQGHPLLLLLAVRAGTEEISVAADVQTLRLQALDSVEAQSAIQAWLPASNPFMVEEIFSQSGGNPLYIEELCHAVAAGGELQSAPRKVGVAWINTLVASRLARLLEPQAECLQLAAVAGHSFAAALLQRLIGDRDATDLLESLAAEDFLVSSGQPGILRFKHALTRDAVYATVEPQRRRTLHLRVAESLEAAEGRQEAFDWLESLSFHYDAAGVPAAAAQYAEAAGDKAASTMALDRARAQYITALRALDALPELNRALQMRWCGIAQKLGLTCVFDPLDVSPGLVRLFERAAELARRTNDVNVLARAEYWLAYVHYGKGRPKDAVQHSEAALGYALTSADARLIAQVQATLGQSLASAGQYGRALPLLKEAVESKRHYSRPGSGAAIGSAYSLARIAYTLGDIGRFEESREVFDDALQLLGESTHVVGASVRELICAVHLWQGRWSEAIAAGEAGAEIALHCRSSFMVAMGRSLAACGAWALHEDAASLCALRESTQWIEARGGAISTSINYGWLVEATVKQGSVAEARQHAARLFRRARAQDQHGAAMGFRALARLAGLQAKPDRALRYLDHADRAAEFRSSARELAVNQLARAELALSNDKAAQARELALRASEAFEAMNMRWHLERAGAIVRSV